MNRSLCKFLLLAVLVSCQNGQGSHFIDIDVPCMGTHSNLCYPSDYDYLSQNQLVELDMASAAKELESKRIKLIATYYKSNYSLSENSSIKVARLVNNYDSLKLKSHADLNEYAERLYGVNLAVITEAIALNQLGDNSLLDVLIERASITLETNKENTKKLINALHGDFIKANAIDI